MLPIFSKIVEKVIHRQLYTHFKQNNMLYAHHYGFRKHVYFASITESHAIYLRQHILRQLYYMYLYTLILRKRLIQLITKFYCLNLFFTELEESHEWLKSYLSERNQITAIDGITFCPSISHDVPQGSALGLLLFLLFINDLQNLSSLFKFILFAETVFCLLRLL